MRHLYVLVIILVILFFSHCSSDGGTSGGNTNPSDTKFTLIPNPNSILSVYVYWKTDQPMTSEVQFGDGSYKFRIRDNAERTVHNILVIGMRAQTNYKIKAISKNNSNGVWEAEDSYTTPAFPEDIPIPDGTMLTNKTDKSVPGWTLMNVQIGNGAGGVGSSYPAMIVMYDHEGFPVWYYKHGVKSDIGGCTSTEFLENNGVYSVLIGPAGSGEPAREVDLSGKTIWKGPDYESVELSHYVGKLSNGHYALLHWSSYSPTQPVLEEVNTENESIKSWRLYEDNFYTPPLNTSQDWAHANSATFDIEHDAVYLSCRWLGLFKMSYTDPKVLKWWMPAKYNTGGSFMPGAKKITYDTEDDQINDIHDPEIHYADNTIMFFDNDGYDGASVGKPGDKNSRVIEYIIDEDTGKATKNWEFPGDFPVDDWFKTKMFCTVWGDANRLENGNVLIAAGVRGTDKHSRIFEVTNAGEVVWDFQLPVEHGVYWANRIKPPLIESL